VAAAASATLAVVFQDAAAIPRVARLLITAKVNSTRSQKQLGTFFEAPIAPIAIY
jgi:hypothetical protein